MVHFAMHAAANLLCQQARNLVSHTSLWSSTKLIHNIEVNPFAITLNIVTLQLQNVISNMHDASSPN